MSTDCDAERHIGAYRHAIAKRDVATDEVDATTNVKHSKAGTDYHIVKPADPEGLTDVVKLAGKGSG